VEINLYSIVGYIILGIDLARPLGLFWNGCPLIVARELLVTSWRRSGYLGPILVQTVNVLFSYW